MSKVAHLQNAPTRYEVVLEHAGKQWLVGYTSRRSRPGLLATMRKEGRDILAITEMPEDAEVRAEYGALVFSQGSVIKFSGRTQRDAVIAGELPWVRS